MATLDTDPYCLTDKEAARLVQGAPWRRLAVLGDSLAAGVGDDVEGYPSGGWAVTVARVLTRVRGGQFAYVNLGERDRLAAEVREQQLAAALAFRPDLAVVLCGGNDMLRRSFHLASVVAEIETMVATFRALGSNVVTFGLMDITRSGLMPLEYTEPLRERLRSYRDAMAELAVRYGAIHVDLSDHPAAAQPASYSTDLLHPNARGHAVIATATLCELATRCPGRHDVVRHGQD